MTKAKSIQTFYGYTYKDLLELVKKDLFRREKKKIKIDKFYFEGMKDYDREPGDLESDMEKYALHIYANE